MRRFIFWLAFGLNLLGLSFGFAEKVSDVALVLNRDYQQQFTVILMENEPEMNETLMSVALNDESELCVLQADHNKYVVSVYDEKLNWIHAKEIVVRNGKLINPVAFYWDGGLFVRFFDEAKDVNVLIDYADMDRVYVLSGADFVDIANVALNGRPAINISSVSIYKLHEFDGKRLVFLDRDRNEHVLYDYSSQYKMEIAGEKVFYILFCAVWMTAMGIYAFRWGPRYTNERLYKKPFWMKTKK